MLCRVNLTSFFGRRSNITSRITRGTRILKETVAMVSPCGFLRGKIAPLVETESLENALVIAQDGVGMALEEERQGAPGRADIDRLPKAVQHQNVLI